MATDSMNGFNAASPDEEAEIDRLYITHFEAVCRYITTHGGSETDAEDIYQEAFLALWRNLKTGKLKSLEEVNVGGYLFNIAKFKWVDQVRKRQTHLKMVKEKAKGGAEFEEEADDQATERIAAVKKYLDQISTSCKKVLLLFYYQKKSMQEIAAEMQWEEATARNNKYRCLQKLRSLMK